MKDRVSTIKNVVDKGILQLFVGSEKACRIMERMMLRGVREKFGKRNKSLIKFRENRCAR